MCVPCIFSRLHRRNCQLDETFGCDEDGAHPSQDQAPLTVYPLFFAGHIPTALGKLERLTHMDLGRNELEGTNLVHVPSLRPLFRPSSPACDERRAVNQAT